MTRLNRKLLACAVAGAIVLPALLRADDTPNGSMGVPVANQALPVNARLEAINGKPLFVEDVLRPIDADLRRIARVARRRGAIFARRRAMRFRSKIKQQVGDNSGHEGGGGQPGSGRSEARWKCS